MPPVVRHTAIALATLALAACTIGENEAPGARPARNVILFVGDGMGVSTLTAIRIHAGQLEGKAGEEHRLPWDEFPHLALVKTYNVNQQVPDSAGTATAMLTGEKTRSGVINIRPAAPKGDCAASRGQELETILEQAERRGLATGIVTTTRVTHATPAAAYAHAPERDWESDADIPAAEQAAGCRDIARQLVEFAAGDGIEVVMGGGRLNFLPGGPEGDEAQDRNGNRRDGRDLTAEWRDRYSDGRYVTGAGALDAADRAGARRIFGLFAPSHMSYEAARAARNADDEPSLTQMTEAAIKALSRSGRGYFLLVEGGRIDHAHHANNAHNALTDGVELARAVAAADAMTDDADTLIIVTADHSHSFTMAGYPTRGNPIFGLVVGNDMRGEPDREPVQASDGKPYTTLGYYAGPGAVIDGARDGVTPEDAEHPEYRQQAVVPVSSGTHGGEDVAAFAKGPHANRLGGVIEQDELYRIMRGALGL